MTVTIPLSKTGKHAGKYDAIVSDEDKDLAELNWCVSVVAKTGSQYAMRKVQKGHILLHRVIMERILGRTLGKDEMVDHIDMNGINCIRENLRLATNAQNGANRPAPKNNKSGYKGVRWHKKAKKWIAQITANGKNRHLGTFDSAEDAYKAYCEAAAKYHGEFASWVSA